MPAAPAPPLENAPTTFDLYHHGEVTVIGWAGKPAVTAHPADFLAEAADLVKGADAAVLAVDLAGVDLFPPGLLGGLKALAKRGCRVLLFDPADDVREILEIGKLDGPLSVRAAG